MAKKKGKQKQHEAAGQASPTAERQDAAAGPPGTPSQACRYGTSQPRSRKLGTARVTGCCHAATAEEHLSSHAFSVDAYLGPISSGTGSLLVSMTWLLKWSVPSLIRSPLAVPWSRARAGAVAGRSGGGRAFAR